MIFIQSKKMSVIVLKINSYEKQRCAISLRVNYTYLIQNEVENLLVLTIMCVFIFYFFYFHFFDRICMPKKLFFKNF